MRLHRWHGRCSRAGVLATSSDLVEMRLRDDAAEWKALVERLEARRVLDIGAGLVTLPGDGEFDLIVAPNDPFAGILEDDARAIAIAKVRRLLARDGLLVIVPRALAASVAARSRSRSSRSHSAARHTARRPATTLLANGRWTVRRGRVPRRRLSRVAQASARRRCRGRRSRSR